MKIHDITAWRKFFAETNLSVGLETARPWIELKTDIAPHIAALVAAIVEALTVLGARISLRETTIGEDFVPRDLGEDAFLYSHHSIGGGAGISRFKASYRLGYFTFDPLGYAGYSELAQIPDKMESAWTLPAESALAYAEAIRTEQIENNCSKYAQPSFVEAGPRPGYVFLALQMPHDTVIRLAPADAMEFYHRVIIEVGRTGRHCVVKRHPRCRDPGITEFLSSASDLSFVTISELSVNQLLPNAERVVVINSTVGLEALIHGRPTLTFGASEYASLTTRIAHLDDISSALSAPPYFDQLRVAKFLLYFFEYYCVRSHDKAGVLRKVQESLAILPLKFGWPVEC